MISQRSIEICTNRGVCEVVDHDAQCARRDLSERRVAERELLNQESIVAEQAGSVLGTREWRNRVGLGIAAVRLWDNLVQGGMHARSFQ
jgi:hypothetical protein